jgi:hypothetical protein
MTTVRVDYCGEIHDVEPGREFVIGREADLDVDDNPYLHRRFLVVVHDAGLWWLVNEGARLSATLSSPDVGLQAWLPPGARVPLVFGRSTVVFSAGPTTYEIDLRAAEPTFSAPGPQDDAGNERGESTIGELPLTSSQRALIVALAEPLLRRDGTGSSAVPATVDAAERLGWTTTKFNRKLDNVCEKFARVGVRGLRGGEGVMASNRRARLVEYATAAGIVTAADLPLLDEEHRRNSGGRE